MKFSAGFNLLCLNHRVHESYGSLYSFLLSHIPHVFPPGHLRPKETHPWGVLWSGEKVFPPPPAPCLTHQPEASITSGADSLRKVATEYQQQGLVPGHTHTHTGAHSHCALHGCSGCARMDTLHMAKLPAQWFRSNHDTRIEQSRRMSRSCYETNKIYLLLWVSRIYETSSLDSVRQSGPSTHIQALKQLSSIQKPTVKRPE